MAFTPFPTLCILGFQVQGDIAGFTLYTDKKNQIVAFLKSPPLEPPSWRQTVMRDRYRWAATRWQSLTPPQRSEWEKATKKASLKLNGVALFVYATTKGDAAAIATIVRQTGPALSMGN